MGKRNEDGLTKMRLKKIGITKMRLKKVPNSRESRLERAIYAIHQIENLEKLIDRIQKSRATKIIVPKQNSDTGPGLVRNDNYGRITR